MNPEEIVHFLPSEELFEKAAIVFEAQKKELEGMLPSVDIQQVGSCAVPGMIGKFDVDVQIRVALEQFQEVVEKMHQHYMPKHPEIWTDSFVAFSNNKEYFIDLVVTIIGTKHDDFYRVRDALIADEKLREEYTALKKSFEGKTYAEYSKAKRDFLGGNGKVRFLEY